MYNRQKMQELASFIRSQSGMDKAALSKAVQEKFGLTKDRSVFYGPDFAIRFCKAKRMPFCNGVVALSTLQKFDHLPFVVCVVTPVQNHMMLANATFLRKISHSSRELRVDNIRGTFTGSNIMRSFADEPNEPRNFESLFASHENYSFEENLIRLVAATNGILPRGKRFLPTNGQKRCIQASVSRAVSFLASGDYGRLEDDLRKRVHAVAPEIAIAALIENVNLRGRIIECLITGNGNLRETLMAALRDGRRLPEVFTSDKLGDYPYSFFDYETETDIKTKLLFLSSNPKGYNIDKLLAFLAREKSVYLFFIVAIDQNKAISTRLCSVFNRQILDGTKIMTQWAGLRSRGVTQLSGESLKNAVFDFDVSIDESAARAFIKRCIDA